MKTYNADGETAVADGDRRGDGQGVRIWNLRCSACFAASSMRSGSGLVRSVSRSSWSRALRRGILSNYYSACVRDLPHVARFVEDELITEKGFRNSYAREDAVPSILTEDELGRLIGSRLLRLVEYHGAQRIELTHDVLTKRRSRTPRPAPRRRGEGGAGGARAAGRQALAQAAAQREAELDRERRRRTATQVVYQRVLALVCVAVVRGYCGAGGRRKPRRRRDEFQGSDGSSGCMGSRS